MGIVDEDIERLRSTVSIVDTIQQYVALKRVGRNWVGLCPFHAEKSGSFNVREETGRYKCFGCDKGGDVFTFIQEIEHVDFPGAVEHLAAKAGIQLNYTTTGQSKERARRKHLIEAMEAAVEWYHQRLLTHPDAREKHASTFVVEVWRATSPASSSSGGLPTTGTHCRGGSAHRPTNCSRSVSRSATSATRCRTPSGPG